MQHIQGVALPRAPHLRIKLAAHPLHPIMRVCIKSSQAATSCGHVAGQSRFLLARSLPPIAGPSHSVSTDKPLSMPAFAGQEHASERGQTRSGSGSPSASPPHGGTLHLPPMLNPPESAAMAAASADAQPGSLQQVIGGALPPNSGGSRGGSAGSLTGGRGGDGSGSLPAIRSHSGGGGLSGLDDLSGRMSHFQLAEHYGAPLSELCLFSNLLLLSNVCFVPAAAVCCLDCLVSVQTQT